MRLFEQNKRWIFLALGVIVYVIASYRMGPTLTGNVTSLLHHNAYRNQKQHMNQIDLCTNKWQPISLWSSLGTHFERNVCRNIYSFNNDLKISNSIVTVSRTISSTTVGVWG